jgi:peptidoglycan hydrolase-like protein with peptidoglycan-binding domain
MSILSRFGSGAILAGCLTASAVAQVAPSLSYVQPLTPSAVQAVQERLRSAHIYSGPVDGVWGPDSAAALQRFQTNNQLQVTGQLNQATAATLGLEPAGLISNQQAVLPPPVLPAENLRPASIRIVQTQLRNFGFYSGGADGIWGGGTASAVERFQQARGLQPNGQLNPATVAALGLSPDTLAYK